MSGRGRGRKQNPDKPRKPRSDKGKKKSLKGKEDKKALDGDGDATGSSQPGVGTSLVAPVGTQDNVQLRKPMSPVVGTRPEKERIQMAMSPVSGIGQDRGRIRTAMSPVAGIGQAKGRLPNTFSPIIGHDSDRGRLGTLGTMGHLDVPSAPGRLASFNTGPTTLGGVAKRSFTPRIPTITRVKGERKPDDKEAQDSKTGRENQQPGGQEKRERQRPQLTPQYGLFSLGPAGAKGSSGGGASGAGGSADVGYFDNGMSTKEDEEAEDYSASAQAARSKEPIMLPMSNYGPRAREQRKVQSKPQGASNIKNEGDNANDDDEVTMLSKQFENIETDDKLADYFHSMAAVNRGLDSLWQAPLLFFQLPPSLPLVTDKAPGPAANPPKPATMGATDDDNFEDQLKKIDEGHMGHLRLHRSGRVTMKLGELTMEIKRGTPVSFIQSVSAISPEHKQLMLLGDIDDRFVCAPVVEDLLAQCQL